MPGIIALADRGPVEIHLEPVTTAHARGLFEAVRESVDDVHPWLPWCHAGYTQAEAEDWTREQVRLRDAGTSHAFAIVTDDGRYLGGCGMHELDPVTKAAPVGYWVRSSAMGQGVAPRAVRLLARWAFAETEVNTLLMHVLVDNLRSHRVAEKAGAQRTGIAPAFVELHGRRHDAVVWALTRPPA